MDTLRREYQDKHEELHRCESNLHKWKEEALNMKIAGEQITRLTLMLCIIKGVRIQDQIREINQRKCSLSLEIESYQHQLEQKTAEMAEILSKRQVSHFFRWL